MLSTSFCNFFLLSNFWALFTTNLSIFYLFMDLYIICIFKGSVFFCVKHNWNIHSYICENCVPFFANINNATLNTFIYFLPFPLFLWKTNLSFGLDGNLSIVTQQVKGSAPNLTQVWFPNSCPQHLCFSQWPFVLLVLCIFFFVTLAIYLSSPANSKYLNFMNWTCEKWKSGGQWNCLQRQAGVME